MAETDPRSENVHWPPLARATSIVGAVATVGSILLLLIGVIAQQSG